MRTSQPTILRLSGLQLGVLGVALIGTFLSVVGLATDTSHFLHIYLAAVLLWTEIAIGCLGIMMLNNLINASWMHVLQRFAEAGAKTLPLTFVFFLPILLGMSSLYPWAGEAASELKLVGGNEFYLQPVYFAIRTVIYFAIWISLAYGLSYISTKLDEREDESLRKQARKISALGIVAYMLTTTLAAFDWTMSLTPEWFSSAYGWLTLSRIVLVALSFLILVLAAHWSRDQFRPHVNQLVINDLGALLLMTVLAWAYMNGISFVVIWSGNVSYFIDWYDLRIVGGWSSLTMLVVVLNGLLIFLLLIPGLKRQRMALIALAAFAFALRIVELYWVVVPASPQADAPGAWWIAGPILAVSGFWLFLVNYLLSQQPLLPARHPVLGDEQEVVGAARGVEG